MPSKIVKILAGMGRAIGIPARGLRSPCAWGYRCPFQWAEWIREHAERTDPLNGALHVAKATSCSYAELQPHMNGRSAHGQYRH